MCETFELTVRAIARIRHIYGYWLICNSFIIFLHVYIISRFLWDMADPGLAAGSRAYHTMLSPLLFINLLLELCYQLSGTGALLCDTQEALQLHSKFSAACAAFMLVIILLAIWVQVTCIIWAFIAIFIAKVPALALVYIKKHATIVQPTHSPFS